MLSSDRILLRLHIEAVWGVQLPPLEQDELELLSTSRVPSWKLCAADIAEGRVCIWRCGVALAEREVVLARVAGIQVLPASVAPPPGMSREVAFHLAAAPSIDVVTAQRLARVLTPSDYALVEAFDPDFLPDLLQPACHPFVGVIIEERLLSLAHSSRRTAEACELGINTLPEARRQGYALAATVAWSVAIAQEGLTPLYSALAENTASLNLAVAAGYREFVRVVTVE
jgi:GNAT acetyltransferase-like protein